MSIQENRAVVRRFLTEAYQNETIVDKVVAPDYVGHFPPNPDLVGREAIRQFNRQAGAAFPDVQVTVEDLIAEGDQVAARWAMRGTHLGELRGGIAPTGKSFAVTGTTTFRLVDGQVAEAWGNVDYFGLFLQLGLVAPPGSAAR